MTRKRDPAGMPREVRLPSRSIYWCKTCQSPVVITDEQSPACPKCGNEVTYMATDLRPVFSRERRILQYYHGMHFSDVPVWRSSKSRLYFVDGRKLTLPGHETLSSDLDALVRYISASNHYDALDKVIIEQYRTAWEVNELYLNGVETNAFDFIQRVADDPKLRRRKFLVSFSGGKDSTVVSSLVTRTLGPGAAMHVFSDTSLEDPNTYNYVQEFRDANPHIEFYVGRVDHSFDDLVDHMGPPSRQIRWCCTIFKAGPINNLLQDLSNDGRQRDVLTFYGVRRSESVQRADYNAITTGAKIGTQVTASPVIDWLEFDIWAYILRHQLAFNRSYRLGYSRVGCWLCPLNSDWSDMLAEIFFPEMAAKWRGKLVEFARKIGKPDPEEYVDDKAWKRRTGGAGLSNSFTGVEAKPCGDLSNTTHYTISRPITEEFLEFMKPLGKINRSFGRSALGEFLVDGQNRASASRLLVQAASGSQNIRVTAVETGMSERLGQLIKNQLAKYETCIQCTACSAVCPHGAITVRPDHRVYTIDEDKCTGCLECVTHFGSRGCLVADSLHSSGERASR